MLVQLSNGQQAIVDDTDYPLVSTYHWHAHRGYAVATPGPRNARRFIRMHRLLCTCPPGLQPDHANGNKLDNRRANLRAVTPSQNSANAHPHSDSVTGYKGIYLDRRTHKYAARIMHQGTRIYLGEYATAEDAARAYDRKARDLNGDYARCNFEDETHVTH